MQQMNMPRPTISTLSQVNVVASARLHMGFFDLSSLEARTFGSLGLSIDAPCTELTIIKSAITKSVITTSEKTFIDAKNCENISNVVENLVNSLKLTQPFSLTIKQTIPAHAGLGSGTQLALAIGAGLNALFDLNLTVPQIATAAKRGARSGIGIAAFEQGGFLVDSGKVSNELPEIALRQAFPDHWRVLLVNDLAHIGVHGAVESQAFKSLKPAQHALRNMIFDHMMPALHRSDLLAFGAYMADLQVYNGNYFAPIQGGRYASQDVADVLDWLQQNGVACLGQSSWGPTGFAIVESALQAEYLQNQAQLAFADKLNISLSICRGNNTGASIQSIV